MVDPFHSPKRRIARAQHHIVEIRDNFTAFIESQPYATLVERNAAGLNEHKVKLQRPIPNGVTDAAYEAIEALRSSLDQTIYAIGAELRVPKPDKVHFPAGDTAADFENSLNGWLKDFPADILAYLRGLKPYKGGDDLIWGLNRIRREGIHRLIVPVGSVSGGMRTNRFVTHAASAEILIPRWDSEKDEIIFARTGPGDVQYEIEFAFFIAFGKVEGLAGQPVLETLDAIASRVTEIVSGLEAESKRLGIFQ